MTPSLTLSSLAPMFAVVAGLTLLLPVIEILGARYRGRLAPTWQAAALRYVSYTCLFSIFGIAQRASYLGLISDGVYLVVIFAALLAVSCSGLAMRHQVSARKA